LRQPIRKPASLNGGVLLVAFVTAGCGDGPARAPEIPAGAPAAALGAGLVPTYPGAPYGLSLGSTIADLRFLGWKDPLKANYDPAAFESVRLSDFHDPDGARGIKLILLNASAVWCGVCRAEFQTIERNDVYALYKEQGVEFVVALFEDVNGDPAKPTDLLNWGSEFTVEFPMLLDPGFRLASYFTADATPLNMVIDARTMKIVSKLAGDTAGLWDELDRQLAKRK